MAVSIKLSFLVLLTNLSLDSSVHPHRVFNDQSLLKLLHPYDLYLDLFVQLTFLLLKGIDPLLHILDLSLIV